MTRSPLRLHRVCRAGKGTWWFSSDMSGRFDLRPPEGTCYQYRVAVLGHGEALLRLLRLRQMNNHEPAHMALQALSGQDFGARDYDAWERWLAAARRTPLP